MARIDVVCRFCGSTKDVRRHGKGSTGNQKFRCLACRKTFHLDYYYEACFANFKKLTPRQLTRLSDETQKIQFICEVDEQWSFVESKKISVGCGCLGTKI